MSKYKFETLQLHVGQEQPDPASDARAVPIYATTSYVFHNSQHAADRFGLADAGNIYGGTSNLLAHTLPLYGIESTFVDAHNLDEVEGAIQDNTKAIYIETLSLRLERHAENAKKVVDYLAKHPKVTKVSHPSLPEHPDHALYEKYFPQYHPSLHRH